VEDSDESSSWDQRTGRGDRAVGPRGDRRRHGPQLRQAIVEIASAGSGPLVIDLEDVDFLDSTGLGVLVSGLKRFRTLGTAVVLVATGTRILKVFEITGLTQVFSIHATVDAAVAAAGSGRQP
jgi:anti-sigma B factor antagonist